MPPLIITRENAAQQIYEYNSRLSLDRPLRRTGCLPRKIPYGQVPGVMPASFYFPRIPRDKWADLIRQGKGTFLGDLTRGLLPPHDQNATNYCWTHGSVRCLEALRIYEGQPPLILSAESVAVPITGGENRGGTPDEALQWLNTKGACDQTLWPLNDRNQKHAKAGWQDEALNHVILQWADVENFDDQMTLALHRVPVAIGLDWWGHLVCQLSPVLLDDGGFGVDFDNSWGPDYGDNGRAILDEEHATARLGAFAPISETFSQT